MRKNCEAYLEQLQVKGVTFSWHIWDFWHWISVGVKLLDFLLLNICRGQPAIYWNLTAVAGRGAPIQTRAQSDFKLAADIDWTFRQYFMRCAHNFNIQGIASKAQRIISPLSNMFKLLSSFSHWNHFYCSNWREINIHNAPKECQIQESTNSFSLWLMCFQM